MMDEADLIRSQYIIVPPVGIARYLQEEIRDHFPICFPECFPDPLPDLPSIWRVTEYKCRRGVADIPMFHEPVILLGVIEGSLRIPRSCCGVEIEISSDIIPELPDNPFRGCMLLRIESL